MVTTTLGHSYPRRAKLRDGGEAVLRLMTEDDLSAVVAFAKGLPADDLLFLRMDITKPDVVQGWIDNIKAGRTFTILAEVDGKVVGYASLHLDGVLWTRHVGEIRVAVNPKSRRLHLGQNLTREIFALAKSRGLAKITAQMTPDQAGARASFERLGFQPEALLADHVVDRNGKTRDLLIMTYNVSGFTDDAP